MEPIEAFLARHEKVVLQFSAGKDSAACLRLVEPWLDRIIVVWTNAGDPYPETVAYMQAIRAQVPHFEEIQGDQPGWVARNGHPSDFVSPEMTVFGPGPFYYAPTLACCNANLWQPMVRYIAENGVTGVIRGQKAGDKLAAPLPTNRIVGGVEYFFPLESWSDEDVIEFLGPDIPHSYKRGLESSLDCATCTGYLSHNKGRLEDLQDAYPGAYVKILPIVNDLKKRAADLKEQLNAF